MKAMSKAVQRRKAEMKEIERKKKREEYLASLTDEEREAFLKKEEEAQRKALKTLAELQAMRAMFGKGYY